ncbi:flavin reductase family protein [Chloroflexota bacterium]
MEKVAVGKITAGVTPVIIAGAIVNGKPNFLTLGNYGGLANRPVPLVYISSIKTHYTNVGIKENGYFSINWPSRDLVEKVNYVGSVSGKDIDKSKVFSVFYGSVDKAPLIEECPVNTACKLIQTLDLPRYEVFIGEIMETFVNKDCSEGDKPVHKNINPLVTPLLTRDGAYWELGNEVGQRPQRVAK